MKIMTFNTQHCLNYIEKKIDFQIMADAIKRCGADIVGLNEMRDKGDLADFDRQTAILSELTGLPYFYFAKAIDVGSGSNPYGNGLLSRYPILAAETVLIPKPSDDNPYYETRCLLKAKLENGLTVLVTHFGLTATEQQNAVQAILANLGTEKCILMGDFNLTPANELLNPLRERLKDAADKFDIPLLSFPSDQPDRKIDYIFVTPDIDVIHADIPAIVASDHRPHTAEIDF